MIPPKRKIRFLRLSSYARATRKDEKIIKMNEELKEMRAVSRREFHSEEW